MSLGVIQFTTGVVYEVLNTLDVLGMKKDLPHFDYDLETVLIVPQAYALLATEAISEYDRSVLLHTVSFAFEQTKGPQHVSDENIAKITEALYGELVLLHDELSKLRQTQQT